jgi:hypothetical protein
MVKKNDNLKVEEGLIGNRKRTSAEKGKNREESKRGWV